jgi:glutathione S-transferase
MPKLLGAFGSPFVRKAYVALTEKGISFEHEQVIPFGVSPEYRKISPLGKIPAYQDGDKTLADSSVIIAYLEKIHPLPALYPSDPYDYARALWFEEFGDGGLAPVLGTKVFFPKVIAPRFFKQEPNLAEIQKVVDTEIPPLFDYLEGEIGDEEYLVGNKFSIADIGVATIFVNYAYAGYGVDAKRWPKLAAYINRILSRPSFKGVIDKEKAALGIQ